MSKTTAPSLLLTVQDVSDALRWGHSKTWRYISEGRIPSVKSDGSRRVRRSDLESFVATLDVDWGGHE
jgi:excisionase family DNA binding protein